MEGIRALAIVGGCLLGGLIGRLIGIFYGYWIRSKRDKYIELKVNVNGKWLTGKEVEKEYKQFERTINIYKENLEYLAGKIKNERVKINVD